MGEVADMQRRVWDNMVNQGFDTTDPRKKLGRIRGELNELTEAWEGGKLLPEVLEETADVVIETLGLAAILGGDLEKAIMAKLTSREYKRVGGELVKEGL